MMKPIVSCPVTPPAPAPTEVMTELQSQIDEIKTATALQIDELKAMVAALAAKLASCGACEHLDVEHDADASSCTLQCKHNTTTAESAVLELQY